MPRRRHYPKAIHVAANNPGQVAVAGDDGVVYISSIYLINSLIKYIRFIESDPIQIVIGGHEGELDVLTAICTEIQDFVTSYRKVADEQDNASVQNTEVVPDVASKASVPDHAEPRRKRSILF